MMKKQTAMLAAIEDFRRKCYQLVDKHCDALVRQLLEENTECELVEGEHILTLAKNIFRQELTEIYQQQTQRRDELAKDSRVAAAYDLWYQLREEVLRTYKDVLPPRLPLSQQKEFKRIKNLVIEEAVRLGEHTEVFSPEDTAEQDPIESDTEL